MVPPPSHNTVGVCHQVTFLILHYITSRLVPLLKVIDAPIQVPYVLDLTVSFKFLNFSSRICLLLSLKCLLTSRLTLFRISTLLWLGSCIHCILARFLWSKKPKHSSSNWRRIGIAPLILKLGTRWDCIDLYNSTTTLQSATEHVVYLVQEVVWAPQPA